MVTETFKYRNRRCLVTGGTGFVGKKLCALLLSNGCELRLLLRRHTRSIKAKQYINDFEKDVSPQGSLSDIDTVFHLAGVAHDDRTDCHQRSDIYRKVNTNATIKLAKLSAARGVKRFIFISSVKAGGSPPQGVCAGETPQREPEGIYGQTKRDAEIALLRIGKQTGMHVSIIRPALVYGPNLKGNLKKMLVGVNKGWFPPIPETSNIRTMIHVDDLLSAILLAAEKEDANGEIFIVTDGKHYSSREIYNEMCLATGHKIPSWSVPESLFFILAKLGDQMGKFIKVPFDSYRYRKLLGDDCYTSSKICDKLGFQPYMTLKDALPEIMDTI